MIPVARTHHASAAYRLSCGDLQEYTSVHQTGDVPKAAVLCSVCRKSAYIVSRYPPDTCGVTCRAENPEGGVVRARCTLKPHTGGNHRDDLLVLDFSEPRKLRSGREGNT